MLSAIELMGLTIERGASDLHINPGRPPIGRLDGKCVPLVDEVLDEEAAETLAKELCGAAQWEELSKVGSTDFGVAHGDGNRFRASVFRQRGRYSAVLRLIPSELLSFEQIGVPEAVQELLSAPRGLILITGPTGSGKTLAFCLPCIQTGDESGARHSYSLPLVFQCFSLKSMCQVFLDQKISCTPTLFR